MVIIWYYMVNDPSWSSSCMNLLGSNMSTQSCAVLWNKPKVSYVAGRGAVRAVLDTFFIGTSVETLSKSYEFMTLRFSCAASSPNVTAGHDWLRARGKTGGTNFQRQRPVRWIEWRWGCSGSQSPSANGAFSLCLQHDVSSKFWLCSHSTTSQ